MGDSSHNPMTKGEGRPGVMERILFARVELWIFLVLILLGGLLVIGFGAAVLDADRKDFRFGSISKTALAIAELPQTAKRILIANDDLSVEDSARDRGVPTGWSFPSGALRGPQGYLLISRYDGTEGRAKIELATLPSMDVVYRWSPKASDLMKGVTHLPHFAEKTNLTDARFRAYHPWLEANGDLIIKDYDSPLFRINACGKSVWTLQDAGYHHSTEADANGDLWIPSVADKSSLPGVDNDFREDLIKKVSPTGKVLFSRSVAQILIRHGFANWLFTNSKTDPTHLNDIQPVLFDGPYWKKGDLFLSMRSLSAVMLYRPSTDEIVWIQRGPWIGQHDVDILDDHRISLYDNAVEKRSLQRVYFSGMSQPLIYDFATKKVSFPLERQMKRLGFQSRVEGRFTTLPDGSMLVADSARGRMAIFRRDGQIAAQYANRARNGRLYPLVWSRYINKAKGDVVVGNLQKMKCDAQPST